MSCSVMIRRAPGLLCGSETTRNAASQEQLTTPSAVPKSAPQHPMPALDFPAEPVRQAGPVVRLDEEGDGGGFQRTLERTETGGLDPGAAGGAQRQVEVAAVVGAAGDAAAIGPDLDLGEVFGKEPVQRRAVALHAAEARQPSLRILDGIGQGLCVGDKRRQELQRRLGEMHSP